MPRIVKRWETCCDSKASAKEDLEINPRHRIMRGLEKMRQNDGALAAQVAEQVLDNAKAAAGLLDDPRTMLNRLNELLERVLETKTPPQRR
ncbi:MAG: hypothetical protein HY735_23310 [Verrucomicrobia bacterium]|nr:hypothetical protein [Verrucomicrobiota bacterium]